jgi:hypothetical protein
MAGMPHRITVADQEEPDEMRRSYVTVVISWLLMLAALFAFQEYFS